MSDEFPPRDSDETRPLPSWSSNDPTMTTPLPVARPSGGRGFIVFLLLLLIGGAIGFGASQIVGQRGAAQTPDQNVVYYENSTSSFPLASAAFTDSTFDAASGQCNRDLLKQYLRADATRMKAWVDLQQVDQADLDSFVGRLQTQILTKLTAVTDHGCYEDGQCPFAVQAVLGPGTPVWTDPQQARVVAKCVSSSPVSDPQCPPNCEDIVVTPTPTEIPTEVPTESPTPTPSATVSPTPTPSATPTPVPTETATSPPTGTPVKTKK